MMKCKAYFKGVIFVSALLSIPTYAMDEEIEFDGETKPLIAFINRAAFSPEADPFSVTEVVRYNKDKNTFTLQGTIAEAYKGYEEDFKEISKGNFIYLPFYRLGKTHLNPSQYNDIGAFLVGTKDPELVNALKAAVMRGLLSPL